MAIWDALRQALRTVRRNLRRSLISVSATGFGVALTLLMLGIADGTYNQLVHDATRMQSGNVTVQHPDYLESSRVEDVLRRGETIRGGARGSFGRRTMRGLTRVFSSEGVETRAVDGLDLTVDAGEFTVLAGPSGSGKTTLLQLIGALDQPTAGSVKVEGRELSTLSRRERSELRRDRIGFVFQNYNLVPVLTALENAEYVLGLQGVPAHARRARVGALFEELEMRGYEQRFPRQLSGGQQQRVAFVRAVVSNPALVLADEPTANVDSKTTRTLVDVMGRLHAEHGVTFLATTHDREVMKRAQRLLWLVDGRVAYDGPPEGFDWS